MKEIRSERTDWQRENPAAQSIGLYRLANGGLCHYDAFHYDLQSFLWHIPKA